MSRPKAPAAPLRPERAFLVQLRETSGGRRLRGRIEHVVSGTSEPFGSVAELLDFMSRHAAAADSASSAPGTLGSPTRRRGPDGRGGPATRED